ncbi:MAG: hypothetical protein EOM25_14515 [Deltaproteobacteria bacterium]|nr:hypothetical protein [Deltaproteobacteria bacterium]
MAAIHKHGKTLNEAAQTACLIAEAPELIEEFGAAPRVRPARSTNHVRPLWGVKATRPHRRSWKARRATQWHVN